VSFWTPPWQSMQFVFHDGPWQEAQEVVVEPPTPSRFAPWHPWQEAIEAAAE
jgi:hypothetical protein